MSLTVLYEDNHLLVVIKPAGQLIQADSGGDESLLDVAKAHRKQAEGKPGNAFVGLVHRLDRPVSGVVVFAKTSKAAARLSQQFRERTVEKRYLAVVDRPPFFPPHASSPPDHQVLQGEWEDLLVKDESTNKVRIVSPTSPLAQSARLARTAWRRVDSGDKFWLLELRPLTGRNHQLRVQSAARGMPIFGDRKYGSGHAFGGSIALHAAAITVCHPTKGARMEFCAPMPESWRRFNWQKIGVGSRGPGAGD